MKHKKCVMVIDQSLPLGLIANTAAVMGITLGKMCPWAVGGDVADKSGSLHQGIITFPVPVLKSTAQGIRALRERLGQPEFAGLTAVDFSDLAQGCKTYEEFTGKMAAAPEESLGYLGLALCGDKKTVDRLTGSMPLLR